MDATARYQTVLVPLDGSEEAERALGPGQWLAQLFGADLHVIAAQVRRDERFWYRSYLDEIVAAHAGVTTHMSDEPDVAQAIIKAAIALDGALVCMATHGRSRSASLLGSTFAALTVANTAPMVAVGPQASPHTAPNPRRVVAAIDDTVSGLRIVDMASAWARALSYSLSIVTVATPDVDEPDAYVKRLAQCESLAGLEVDAQAILGTSGPHAELARHLGHRPASLLAVATHARTGLARTLLGSEAARIIHDSPVPVLTRTSS